MRAGGRIVDRGGFHSISGAARAVGDRGPRAAEVADYPIESAALDSLHGVVAKSPCLADIEDWYNVGMMQARRGPGFVQEPAACRWVGGRVGAQHLECHGTVQGDVDRLVDGSHAAAAQLANHTITRDLPA